MVEPDKLLQWLPAVVREVPDRRYRHRLVSEDGAHRSSALKELRKLIRIAHEDARQHIRALVQIPLDPLHQWDPKPSFDPAEGYPELLHPQTLKGYFGEIFAALIAQWMDPFDEHGWQVPAFLFRHHVAAFQQLEAMRRSGRPAGIIPGRTGDDCLAFKVNDEGRITHVLYCESKCLARNSHEKIADAHEKVSNSEMVDIPRLIDVLKDRRDQESERWVARLRRLMLLEYSQGLERLDLVTYVCGNAPVRGDRETWIAVDAPHVNYTAARRLEAVEVHLTDLDALVAEAYRKEEAHVTAE